MVSILIQDNEMRSAVRVRSSALWLLRFAGKTWRHRRPRHQGLYYLTATRRREAPLVTPSTLTVRRTAGSGQDRCLELDMRLYPEALRLAVHGRSAGQQWPWRSWSTENIGEHASCRVGEARQPRLASAWTTRLTGKMTTGGVNTRSPASCARRCHP